jgi:D-sedoheptulose 7-phosphate isomerase
MTSQDVQHKNGFVEPKPRGVLPADLIRGEFLAAGALLTDFVNEAGNLDRIAQAATVIADAFRAGNKVLACGNGGSACDSMHFCEEFTGRYRLNRPALPAVACIDPGHLTCTANDFGYTNVFSRWVEGLGNPGDVLVVLSTSGNSENIARAVETAKAQRVTTIGLLGKTGGMLKGACDLEWIVPGRVVVGGGVGGGAGRAVDLFADRIQEIHMLLLHVLIAAVENNLAPGGDWTEFERVRREGMGLAAGR